MRCIIDEQRLAISASPCRKWRPMHSDPVWEHVKMFEPAIGLRVTMPKQSLVTFETATLGGRPMTGSIDPGAELLTLQAELEDLESVRNELPDGAHIHALFQIAIVRIEERIATLQRVRALIDEPLTPRLEAAAA
jgi:hypothetical protein